MDAATSGLSTIVLAAGASTRLGQPKQLVPFAGEALVRRAARIAQEAGSASVLVALGAESERCREALKGSLAECLLVEEWREGMGVTLAVAMRHLLSTREPAAVAVLLCDQYRVEPEHLRTLAGALANGPKGIAAARDGAWLGPPAIFRPRWFSALALMEGERGARSLIARHPEDVEVVECPGIAADLDDADDLERLRQAQGR